MPAFLSGLAGLALVVIFSSPAAADMPNATLTPGAVADTNPSIVCAYGYASAHRNVPYAMRDRIYDEYGIPRGHRRGLRVDHLIPLEIGGANDPRNLWPQTFRDSKVKDRVEDALHEAVCDRDGYRGIHLTLEQAQAAIAHDWTRTPVGLPEPR